MITLMKDCKISQSAHRPDLFCSRARPEIAKRLAKREPKREGVYHKKKSSKTVRRGKRKLRMNKITKKDRFFNYFPGEQLQCISLFLR